MKFIGSLPVVCDHKGPSYRRHPICFISVVSVIGGIELAIHP